MAVFVVGNRLDRYPCESGVIRCRIRGEPPDYGGVQSAWVAASVEIVTLSRFRDWGVGGPRV